MKTSSILSEQTVTMKLNMAIGKTRATYLIFDHSKYDYLQQDKSVFTKTRNKGTKHMQHCTASAILFQFRLSQQSLNSLS